MIDELSDDLLLLTATREGELAIPAKMRFALAGAELVRLAAAGHVEIDRGRIVVRDAAPTGDSLLDAALASMAGGWRRPAARAWVARNRRGLVERYLARAEAAGTIRQSRRKAPGLFPVAQWALQGVSRAAQARDRLAAIESARPIRPEQEALVRLSDAIGLLQIAFPGPEALSLRARIQLAPIGRARTGGATIRAATGAATAAAMEAAVWAATDAVVDAVTIAVTGAGHHDTGHHHSGHHDSGHHDSGGIHH